MIGQSFKKFLIIQSKFQVSRLWSSNKKIANNAEFIVSKSAFRRNSNLTLLSPFSKNYKTIKFKIMLLIGNKTTDIKKSVRKIVK